MSAIYDNWERLVDATLKREELWQLCHAHSREPSIASTRFSDDFSSSSVSPSPLPTIPFHSWHTSLTQTDHADPFSRDKLKPEYVWYDKLSGFWGKVGTKLLGSVLSRPFPPKSSNTYTRESQQSGPPQYVEQNGIQRLLLIGCNGSGTSTIFKQAVDIFRPDCKALNVGIENFISTIRLSSLDFSLPDYHLDTEDYDDTEDLHHSLVRFQLIKLLVKDIGESGMWLPMFGDVQIVLFCISLSDYDQFSIDDDGSAVNKIMLSKRLFEQMVTHPAFDQISFLLVLNNFDLFEEKIVQVPLSQCDWFDDFHPLYNIYTLPEDKNANGSIIQPSLGQTGFHYIAGKFKRLYLGLTGRKLYISLVGSTGPNGVAATLKYAREILKWNKEAFEIVLSGYSSESNE